MKTIGRLKSCLLLSALLAVPSKIGLAQQNFDEVEIGTVEVADGVFMLTGSGGNLGLSVGDDGAFLIDDQYAPLTDKIRAAIQAQTDKDVQFVLNTHWHGDHTGGNERWGDAGAIIVAHENVRKSMSIDQFIEAFNMEAPAAPEGALPVVTFTESLTFHWNDDEIHVFHTPHAHTDGDAVVHFKNANVIHGGDILFNGGYPFVDAPNGGSLSGLVMATKKIWEIAVDDTQIIPGHGAVMSKTDVGGYYEMLVKAHELIKAQVDEGKSRDEVIAAKPTASLDEAWGSAFLPPDMFVGVVYDGMTKDHH